MAMNNDAQVQSGSLRERWQGRGEAIENIIAAAKRGPQEDWTRLLEGGAHFPDVESSELCGDDGPPAGSTLYGKDLRGIDLHGRDLCGVHLEDARLDFADLSGCVLNNAFLKGAGLSHANLCGTSLVGANLEYTDFTKACLANAKLRLANLHRSELVCAILDEASLIQADLRNATLDQASMRNARLHHADLTGASLRTTDLSGAHLTGARLENAKVDNTTAFWCEPKGLFGREVVRDEEEAREDQRKRRFKTAETAYAEAQSVYHGLAVAYRNAGIHNQAAACYYREMVCHRKARYPKYLAGPSEERSVRALFWSSKGTVRVRLWILWQWLFVLVGRAADLVIFDWLCAYGEKLWRTVACSVAVILSCALVYYCLGGQIARSHPAASSADPPTLKMITLPTGSPMALLLVTLPMQAAPSRNEVVRETGLRNYGEALYFSVVVFTTLGFGDLHPDLPWERTSIVKGVVAFEALSGVVLMSLLMAIFFRRVRRQ